MPLPSNSPSPPGQGSSAPSRSAPRRQRVNRVLIEWSKLATCATVNWFDTWRREANSIGLDAAAVAPVPMDIGFVDNPDREQKAVPLLWLPRPQVGGGALEFHKFLLNGGKRSTTTGRAAQRVTLDVIRRTLDVMPEDPTRAVIVALTRGALHEFKTGGYYAYKEGTDPAACLRAQFGDHARSPWRMSMTNVGPQDPLLIRSDFDGVVGSQARPVSKDEIARIIVAGQKRIFDALQLVRPTYYSAAPPSIAAALQSWSSAKIERERTEAALREAAEAAAAEVAEERRRRLLPAALRDKDFSDIMLDWSTVTPDELQRALEAAPSTYVAMRYGVSSSRIRRKAEEWNLALRPRSHWSNKSDA